MLCSLPLAKKRTVVLSSWLSAGTRHKYTSILVQARTLIALDDFRYQDIALMQFLQA